MNMEKLYFAVILVVAGGLVSYIFYILRTHHDYKVELFRRKLDAYEDFCRNALFVLPEKIDKQAAQEHLKLIRPLLLYCSQKVFDRIQELLGMTLYLVLTQKKNAELSASEAKEFLKLNQDIVCLVRKEITKLKLRKLGQISMVPPLLRKDSPKRN